MDPHTLKKGEPLVKRLSSLFQLKKAIAEEQITHNNFRSLLSTLDPAKKNGTITPIINRVFDPLVYPDGEMRSIPGYEVRIPIPKKAAFLLASSLSGKGNALPFPATMSLDVTTTPFTYVIRTTGDLANTAFHKRASPRQQFSSLMRNTESYARKHIFLSTLKNIAEIEAYQFERSPEFYPRLPEGDVMDIAKMDTNRPDWAGALTALRQTHLSSDREINLFIESKITTLERLDLENRFVNAKQEYLPNIELAKQFISPVVKRERV